MRFFDLHCDTITVLEGKANMLYSSEVDALPVADQTKAECLYSNNIDVSLERAGEYESYAQVFAVFIPDELRGQEAATYFDRIHAFYLKEIAENAALISDYFGNKDTVMKAVFAVEGGAAAAGTIEGLRHLHDCGVKLMTLTWNAQNEIGSGCHAEIDGGLTEFGVSAVKEMERLGMVVDVSHLSKKGFWDVAEVSSRPFIASHSNCDIVDNIYARKRNLSDDQVKCLVERGGLMGINLCADFLGNGTDISFDAVYRHISHALDLGAERILCFGCDYDGCKMAPEFRGVEKMRDIYNFLLSKNMSNSLCEAIFYGNADEFFRKMA